MIECNGLAALSIVWAAISWLLGAWSPSTSATLWWSAFLILSVLVGDCPSALRMTVLRAASPWCGEDSPPGSSVGGDQWWDLVQPVFWASIAQLYCVSVEGRRSRCQCSSHVGVGSVSVGRFWYVGIPCCWPEGLRVVVGNYVARDQCNGHTDPQNCLRTFMKGVLSVPQFLVETCTFSLDQIGDKSFCILIAVCGRLSINANLLWLLILEFTQVLHFIVLPPTIPTISPLKRL